MVFSLFCFFCILAQGFSLKMQLVEQKTWFWTRFITFLESKTLKTLILDRFVSENTIKQMLLQHFAFSLTEGTSKGSQLSSKRGIHRNTHKAWSKILVSRPPIARAIFKNVLKIRVWQKTRLPYMGPKICNGKTKGLATRSQKQYTFENCIVLHEEVKNNTL